MKICQHCKKEYKNGGGYTFTFKSEAWNYGSYASKASLCRACSKKFVKVVRRLNEEITGFPAVGERGELEND